MTPPFPEESSLPPASVEVGDGQAPTSPSGQTGAGSRSVREVAPAALPAMPTTAPVVLGPGDPGEPGWVEAHSIGEVEELVRTGHTVVVTPADLAATAATPPRRAGRAVEEADATAGSERDAEAAELTAASICAWAGARVFRTNRREQVRLAVEMTDSLAGRRPPALTRRGLA
ncbi:hypothetical protein OG884_10630 [Streptosporangium sp. NBC_01755]|uniref:hypothetical protein n=1 Tax=unclassified Streptosporangium TaxID=2632669 RepID=UPI002DD9F040|nr:MULTISPECIES: hypothetical protein [unclassified Streptosporangium]WSA26238.1 hypothetical protein OIE13_36055 [Streptosporangium sp. NBC_01810]WSD02334.1 hypothetical protein OG884_10630 [Streptosporangium sp. NBC_01755]